MMTRTRLTGLLLCAAPFASTVAADECVHEAERTAVVSSAGAEHLRVTARAGELRVEGRQGLTEVRVRGRACTSDEERLDEIRLVAERRGDVVHVEAVIPDDGGWFDFDRVYSRLDLVIEVPSGIAADVVDSSGPLELSDLGELTLDDSSGSILVERISGAARIRDSSGPLCLEHVTGPVDITDSSGSICVADVDGDVEIDDSSGGIDVRGVTGSVGIRDSSGGIEVTGTTGGVTVHRDTSGSIRVRDIGGDFVVRRDSSGNVSYRNVGGATRIAGR